MAKRNRDTLKNFFSKGALPSEEQFHDLIDSAVNQIDEGFDKSPEGGLEITPVGNHDGLISFFRSTDPERSLWSINYGANQQTFLFNNNLNDVTPLSLTDDGKVGVNTNSPCWTLDVNGVISAQGRVGTYRQGMVPADGKWHNVTEELDGVQAFEIMAGAGLKGSGKYALIHAIALNTFNPKGAWFNIFNRKKRIKCHQAYYRSISDKLKLRWIGENHKYYLQLRSNSDYGENIGIRFYVSKLWFDEDMSDSVLAPPAVEPE